MNTIKKALLVIIILHLYSARADVCSPLKTLLTQKPINGLRVYDYIQEVGSQVFVDQNQDLNNLLELNPEIKILRTNDVALWNELSDCISEHLNKAWNRLNALNKKELIDKTLQKAEINGGLIESINAELSYYSKMLPLAHNDKALKKLGEQIKELSQLYEYSLNQLPHATWYAKSPSDVVDAYSMNLEKPFNLNTFFNGYKKIKKIAAELKKTKDLPEQLYKPFIFKNFIESAHLNFFSNDLFKDVQESEVNQLKLSMFINFLEELIYQSKNNKPKYFWQSQPKDSLTKEQQRLAQEIINLLYSLYPALHFRLESLMKRISLARSDEYVAPLLIFAQSRVLLIVLRAYLRKAGLERKNR